MNNRATVETYIDGFRESDHAKILSCLTDDVEWLVPGAFHVRGKQAFDEHIESDCFVGPPAISVTRLTEEHNVIVVEGTVRMKATDGAFVDLAFCDVCEMRDTKVRRLTSYLVQTNPE